MLTIVLMFFAIFVSSSLGAINDTTSTTRTLKGKCVLPPYPENGSYEVTNVNNAKPGEGYKYVVFVVTCEEGFEVPNGLQPVCYNGYWNGVKPTCAPLQPHAKISAKKGNCILPPYPEHGSYVTNITGALPGEGYLAVVYATTCDEGYEVSGRLQAVCYNGYWNGPKPTCVPVKPPEKISVQKGKCILPPYPEHGSYVTNITGALPGERYLAVVVTTTCDKGYEVPGRLQAVCYNGYWNGVKPECVLSSTPTTSNRQSTRKPTPNIAVLTASTTLASLPATDNKQQPGNSCVLPSYPSFGGYTTNIPNTKPGERHGIVAVNVTCQEGYQADGPDLIFCYSGIWSAPLPQCLPLCQLPQYPSVEYHCLVSLDGSDGFRACREFEPSGTTVRPSCRPPYYSTAPLKFMHCANGEWSSVPKCTPECGTLVPIGTRLVLGGQKTQRGEFPWHVAIYSKKSSPYKQICGGSLISTSIVISAAHCFWSNLLGKLPASEFAVAVGKLYRPWDSKLDTPQLSDVESIQLPIRFQGPSTNYQDDIAVLVLTTAVQYNLYVRPVCLDFDASFERQQLQPGVLGKVAGWGLTAEDGGPARELRVVDLPYVSEESCITHSPASFTPYITSDKICAGFLNASTALCRGDSGGGLAFPVMDKGTVRYYLRGVASAAPAGDHLCNGDYYTAFTRLLSHEHFITRFWGD